MASGNDGRVGRRYAQALFTTALKYDVVSAVESDLESLNNILDSDKNFRDLVLAPYTSREEKTEILEKLFSDRMTALTMQVLRVVLEKQREQELPAVYKEFTNLRRDHEGIIFAHVVSAQTLLETQKKALLSKLAQSLGKKVEADFKVDPRVLGGISVTHGTYVIDGTVKGALNQLRQRLRHDLLKQQS